MTGHAGRRGKAGCLFRHCVETLAKSTAFELLTQKIYEAVKRGVKLRVGGNEKRGPIAGQASGDRKQAKVDVPVLVEEPCPLKPTEPSQSTRA